MKQYIFLVILVTSSIFASFDFGECSGSGTFKQKINYYNGDYENVTEVGIIPEGIEGLYVELSSDKDVDIRLYGNNNDKIVHWPDGILNGATKKSTSYKGTIITYSGYNGQNGRVGDEYIQVKGATPTSMTMKAFGYNEGFATVKYSWSGKKGCNPKEDGQGHFVQSILKKNIKLVGTIPPNIKNLNIQLSSSKDLDIQLYGEDGTAIVSWSPKGLLSGASYQTINYNGMTIVWSGYNGTSGRPGHEYIKVLNKTSETLTLKVYGYESGDADVYYQWGNIDKTPPIINIIGERNTAHEIHKEYKDLGARAIDDKDGEVTVEINSSVDTEHIGSYAVRYKATDSTGNTATALRKVLVNKKEYLNVIGAWNFDEDNTSKIQDVSGYGHPLTISNYTNNHVGSIHNMALKLDASKRQNAIISAVSKLLQPESISISAWIKPDDNHTRWEWIAAQGDNYGLYILPDKKKLVFYKKKSGDWEGLESPSNTIELNKWQHVVSTFDSETGKAKLFINSQEVQSKTLNKTIVYNMGYEFTIGSMKNERYFSGVIDEVILFNKALSINEIDNLYNKPIVDKVAPNINLHNIIEIDVLQHTNYIDPIITVSDNIDKNITLISDVNTTVNTNILGTYTITYKAIDGSGNISKSSRIVNVIESDTKTPILTLKGANPQTILKNQPYKEYGYEVSDNISSIENININIDTSNIDTSKLGSYNVVYKATDEANNTVIKQRVVNIVDYSIVDESIFENCYDGSDMPENARRGSIEFSKYNDLNDPGAHATWLRISTGNIISVYNDTTFYNALKNAKPGDRIQLESGIYKMRKINISGLENKPITIESKPGNWAIFDGSLSGSASQIDITGSWLNFRRFEVKNGKEGSLFITKTHHSLFEGLKIHDNARGLDLTDGSHHCLIRYCEAYYNFSASNHGQDGDGFSIWSEGKYNKALGAGIILEHNIAWANADDGIDMWMNETTVTMRNNISRHNGYNVLNDPNYQGNGNGFKLGPLGTGHIVIGNISDSNTAIGFDYNGGKDSHYMKGNISTYNGVQDYDIPHRTVFEDNYQTGDVLAE